MNIMTGDPNHRHATQSLIGHVSSPIIDAARTMFPNTALQHSPAPFQLPASQYEESSNRFHINSTFNQCPNTNAAPFQFSLPNLNVGTNSFVFTPPLPDSPPLSQSTSVVHFPFANSLPMVNHFQMQKPSTSSFSNGNVYEINKFTRDSLRLKRKTDSIGLPPLKQHITEEKMAESMSRLHICSETPVSSSEPEEKRIQRLYMCDEMRRLQAESIIPHPILSKLNKPCTALIPWTPPAVALAGRSATNSNDNNNNNNNNEEEIDNYTSDSDRSAVEIEVEQPKDMDMDL